MTRQYQSHLTQHVARSSHVEGDHGARFRADAHQESTRFDDVEGVAGSPSENPTAPWEEDQASHVASIWVSSGSGNEPSRSAAMGEFSTCVSCLATTTCGEFTNNH